LKKLVLIPLILFAFGAVIIGPIDKTPLEEQPFYGAMMNRLELFRPSIFDASASLSVGWSKFSIIPDYPMPMAGYKPRDEFTSVHDTLYMRITAIDNGRMTAYLISADMLIFPPALKDRILEQINTSNSFVYLAASHTHTGVGGWDPSLLGRVLMGKYDDQYVEQLAERTLEHMAKAKESSKPAAIQYWERDVRNYISNRINRFEQVDSKFRGLSITREDGSKALIFVLGAHATFIDKRWTELSGDFPNAIIHEISDQYEHAQFMAGMMGSQRFRGLFGIVNYELVTKTGKLLSNFMEEAQYESPIDSLEIRTGRVPILNGKSQLRLTKHLKLRDWVFRLLSKPLEAEITVLKIGNILWLGTSCDFSGEIAVRNHFEEYANAHGLKLIVTSFNGEYTGYITADKHYFTSDYDEVRILNWVGPYYGEYYTQIIKRVMDKASAD